MPDRRHFRWDPAAEPQVIRWMADLEADGWLWDSNMAPIENGDGTTDYWFYELNPPL